MSDVPIDFQEGVSDFDHGFNESILFSVVCRMTQMNAQNVLFTVDENAKIVI